MVYSIGRKSPFKGAEPKSEVIGDWDVVEFRDPTEVDIIAKAKLNPAMSYGYAVAPESAPHAVIWQSRRQLPLDYALGNNKIVLVSKRFREMVEGFEPGVHQFLPVAILHSKNDSEPFDTFYWFVCCALIDSLDPEQTTLTWRGFYDECMEDGLRRGEWYFDQSVEPKPKPVFDLQAIGGHHLWRDPYINGRTMVHCSAEFGEELIEAGLTGFALNPKEQVQANRGVS